MKTLLKAVSVLIALAASAQVVMAYTYEDRINLATEVQATKIIRLIELQQNLKGLSDDEILNNFEIQEQFPDIQSYADIQKQIEKETIIYSKKIKKEREIIISDSNKVKNKKVVEEPGI